MTEYSDISKLLIITGERKMGKTTFCRRVIELAQQAGWRVGGVLSPAVFENSKKIAINLLDLKKGEKHQLARARREDEQSPYELNWIFDKNRLAWGNEVLAEALPADLLVVDELGPLEFLHAKGWQNGMRALDGGQYRLALVVIRPELLEEAQKRWPKAEVIHIKTADVDEKLLEKVMLLAGFEK